MPAATTLGVTVMGVNNRVTQSTIFNTGRSGIRLDSGSDQIDHNRIYNIGLLTTDFGAIYTFGIDGAGSQIDYNIISNVHSGGFGAAGSISTTIRPTTSCIHNVVYDADFALKMNPDSIDNRIYNNTLIGTQASVASSFGADMREAFSRTISLAAPQPLVRAQRRRTTWTHPS